MQPASFLLLLCLLVGVAWLQSSMAFAAQLPPPETPLPLFTLPSLTEPSGLCRELDLGLELEPWSPPDQPCTVCECLYGVEVCLVAECAAPSCEYPVQVEGACCPTCLPSTTPAPAPEPAGCLVGGVLYEEGQRIGASCDFCECFHRLPVCNHNQTCPSVAGCSKPVTYPGDCCPSCPGGCLFYWNWYDNSAAINTGDPCNPCTCNDGRKHCEQITCASLTCENSVQLPGQCCPTCTD